MSSSKYNMQSPKDSFDIYERPEEMEALIRSYDWSKTSLGPIDEWSQTLNATVRLMISSSFPIALFWLPDLTTLYNDALIFLAGSKHPRALGKSLQENWPELLDVVEPMIHYVLKYGKPTWSYDRCLFINRNHYLEEIYCIWSYTPIHDERGKVCGVLCPCTETTERVLSERRMSTLRLLANKIINVATVSEACDVTADALSQNPADIPFMLIYLFEDNGENRDKLILYKATGFTADDPSICPKDVDFTLPNQSVIWPFEKVLSDNRTIILSDFDKRNIKLPGGKWPEPTKKAILLPICISNQAYAKGVFILGVNSRRELNEAYRTFFELLVAQFAKGLATIWAHQAEKKRSEYFAELNRTKTIFFNNISHEFRTPLTLILGQTQKLLQNEEGTLTSGQLEQVDTLNRNALLLLKQVNNLLDFSKIEANRMRASFMEVNLCTLTYDLASQFRSLIENAGLKFNVECKTFTKKAYVDPEMWGKIIQNLLVNAFKFTFSGQISIYLKQKFNFAVLTVTDTGIGIPQKEIPHIFERFYRVAESHGRTHEGSGIGLALVHEIVRQHSGKIVANSIHGQGTTFKVMIPLGTKHLPIHQIRKTSVSNHLHGSELYINEAMRWADPAEKNQLVSVESEKERHKRDHINTRKKKTAPTIVVADDNADMRDYILRILMPYYNVISVPDGVKALQVVLEHAPNLVLSDVMMPRMNGFDLLRYIRNHPTLKTIPIIFISGRMDEESHIRGLNEGVDDYLFKPFNANELLARINVQLMMLKLRRTTSMRIWHLLDEKQTIAKRLNLALDAANIGTWRWSVFDDKFTVYPRLRKILNLRKEKISCLNDFLQLITEKDREVFEKKIKSAIKSKKLFSTEFCVSVSNHGVRILTIRGRYYAHSENSLDYMIGVCLDITDKKMAENHFKKQQAKIQNLSKYMTANETATILAHELNQPLAAISTYAQLCKSLSSQLANDSKLQTYIDIIAQQTLRAGKITHHIKDLTSKKTFRYKKVEINKILKEAVDYILFLNPPYLPKIQFELTNLPLINIDRIYIQQVIINIIMNAIEAIQYSAKEDGLIIIQSGLKSTNIEVNIINNGPPISKKIQKRIFEPYFSTKANGMGVGLSMCKTILEAHGGYISLAYSHKTRTCINLQLPLF